MEKFFYNFLSYDISYFFENFVKCFFKRNKNFKVDFHKIKKFLKIPYVYPMKFHIFSKIL